MEEQKKNIVINIRSFGSIADIIGAQEIQVYDIDSSDALVDFLHKKYYALQTMTYTIARNKKLIQTNCILQSGDEIALLPPFSGG